MSINKWFHYWINELFFRINFNYYLKEQHVINKHKYTEMIVKNKNFRAQIIREESLLEVVVVRVQYIDTDCIYGNLQQ